VEIEARFFYSNALEVTLTPFDVSLKFQRRGTVTESAPATLTQMQEGTGVIQEAVVIGMSPQHAKVIIPALVQMVQEYEKRFGTINLPADAIEKWNKLVANATGTP